MSKIQCGVLQILYGLVLLFVTVVAVLGVIFGLICAALNWDTYDNYVYGALIFGVVRFGMGIWRRKRAYDRETRNIIAEKQTRFYSLND